MTFFDIKFAAFGIKVANCKNCENNNACARWVEQAGFWKNLAIRGTEFTGGQEGTIDRITVARR